MKRNNSSTLDKVHEIIENGCNFELLKSYHQSIVKETRPSIDIFLSQEYCFSFRSNLLMYINEAKKETPIKTDKIFNIIDLSIKSAKNMICSADIPFILLEDLFDSFDLKEIENIWLYMENRKKELSDRFFLPETSTHSKLSFLRACLGLLKRASKSEHGELCGRILLYLSSSLPLMEKSGLNLSKSYNLSNSTNYDDEEKAMECLQIIDNNSNNNDYDENEMKNSSSSSSTTTTNSGISETPHSDSTSTSSEFINYVLYSQFWNLQKYLKNPLLMNKEDEMKTFTKEVDAVLKAFEMNNLSDSENKKSKNESSANNNNNNNNKNNTKQHNNNEDEINEENNNNNNNNNSTFNYFTPKYLTSSSLLKLQLKDPTLRMQYLCQILICLQFLSKDSNKNTTKDNKEKTKNEEVLSKLQKRALKLVSKCNENMKHLLKSLLEEEDKWSRWKDDKCSDNLERPYKILKTDYDISNKLSTFSEERVMEIVKPNLAELFDVKTEKVILPLEKTRLDLLDEKKDSAESEMEVETNEAQQSTTNESSK